MDSVADLADFKRVRLRTYLRGQDDVTAFPGRVDPAAAVGAMRAARKVGVLGVVLGLVLLTVWLVVALIGDAADDDLVATGTRVQGVVVDEHGGTKILSSSIDVRFTPIGGVSRVESINVNSLDDYGVGTLVEVIYDPADPTRVRTPDELNAANWQMGVAVVSFAFGGILVSGGVVTVVCWQRRLARVGQWRRARATTGKIGRRDTLELDEPTMWLTTIGRPLPASLPRTSEVWVTGSGTAWTVLFGHGPFVAAARTHDRIAAPGPLLDEQRVIARRRLGQAVALTVLGIGLLALDIVLSRQDTWSMGQRFARPDADRHADGRVADDDRVRPALRGAVGQADRRAAEDRLTGGVRPGERTPPIRYGSVSRCGATVLAKFQPFDASQLIDHVIAPRMSG
ncbi:DUF3592 domain-containing protein [Actinokineospora sp. HUAS TT18]|uniref:DUF3592 domain-containing protein n=1 Tax=Actinokineospora sp. HUAS TT18 TaxID=3447451 RepID=UPI003F523FF0